METKNLHYKLTDEKIKFSGKTLYRIQAIKDLPIHNIKIGDLGGWIEKESNLQDNAWVADEAKVYGNAKVYENALIYESAEISEKAKVYGSATVCGDAKVYGNSQIYEKADIFGNALIYDNSRISGNSRIYGNSKIYDNSIIYDNSKILGNSRVYGNSIVYGNAFICGYADIQSDDDLCTFSYFGKYEKTITFFNTKNSVIGVNYGYFYGTVDEFIEEIRENYKDSKFMREFIAIIEVIKIKFNIKSLRVEN